MPNFHNADRFLATNIANLRYVKAPADDTAALRNAATSVPTEQPRTFKILPPSNPRVHRFSTPDKNSPTSKVTAAGTGNSSGADLGSLLKSFFQIFLGSTSEQEKVTPEVRVMNGTAIFKNVVKWCNSENADIGGDKLKSAVRDSFDGLQSEQKSNFLERCKKFIESMSADGHLRKSVKSHPLLNFAEMIYLVCEGRYAETSQAAQSRENGAANRLEKNTSMPLVGFQRADYPDDVPEAEIIALVSGKA